MRPGDRPAVLAELSGTVAEVLVDAGDTVRSNPKNTAAAAGKRAGRHVIEDCR